MCTYYCVPFMVKIILIEVYRQEVTLNLCRIQGRMKWQWNSLNKFHVHFIYIWSSTFGGKNRTLILNSSRKCPNACYIEGPSTCLKGSHLFPESICLMLVKSFVFSHLSVLLKSIWTVTHSILKNLKNRGFRGSI